MVVVGKPEGKRSFRRPGRSWGDNIEVDLQEIGLGGLGRSVLKIGTNVNTVMNLRFPIKCYKICDWLRNCYLFKELLCSVECVMERKVDFVTKAIICTGSSISVFLTFIFTFPSLSLSVT